MNTCKTTKETSLIQEPNFLEDEECCRCHGPLLAEPIHGTLFVEESFDYIDVTYFVCYACGHKYTLTQNYHF